MLKENVVVVRTAENEEGAHSFQAACQLTTGPLRENSRPDESYRRGELMEARGRVSLCRLLGTTRVSQRFIGPWSPNDWSRLSPGLTNLCVGKLSHSVFSRDVLNPDVGFSSRCRRGPDIHLLRPSHPDCVDNP